MNRNYLKGRKPASAKADRDRDRDRSNAVLAAAGYNFSLLLCWLQRLWRALVRALLVAPHGAEIT